MNVIKCACACGGASTLQNADKHERMIALSQTIALLSSKTNQAIMQLASYLQGFIKKRAVQHWLRSARLGLTSYHMHASH